MKTALLLLYVSVFCRPLQHKIVLFENTSLLWVQTIPEKSQNVLLKLEIVAACYAWFNSNCYHPPPGEPPEQVQPFGPGGGELFETVLSRG